MTYDEFNAFCASLRATSHVVQWGGSHVWKVDTKVFAIGGWEMEGRQISYPGITFKVSEIGFEMLKDQPGLRPAPYLASRGMKWIQHYAAPGLSDPELQAYLAQSHHIVAQGLSRKRRRELGIDA
jgi:predicted DNA-binding protein (MmcQ/YjbR family)